jgi:hypothetical protein
MTPISRRLLTLYLAALLALATLGAHNQTRLALQSDLEDQQVLLQARLGSLRQEAAQVTGALAVREWAKAQQMVASPDALNILEVNTRMSPQLALAAPQHSGVEVQTLWH